MAKTETWEKLRYFKPNNTNDNWGDPDAIADELLLKLDDLRHFLGSPLYVSRGVASSGHAPNSYHYASRGACAVDVIVPKYDKGPINLVMDAERFGFTGLGFYPSWQYAGKCTGGLHLDTRPLKWEADETLNYRYNRWLGVPENQFSSAKLIYLALNMENLITYGRKYGHIQGDLVLDNGKLSGDLD